MTKKLFSVLILSAVFGVSAKSLRIDITGLPGDTVPQNLSKNGTWQTLKRKVVVRSLQFPATGDWQKFSFELTVQKDCRINLNLRATDERKIIVDDVAGINAVIQNGGFEKADAAKGRINNWKAGKDSLFTQFAHSGKNAVQVAYKSSANQGGILLAAGKKAVISGFYRMLDPKAVGKKTSPKTLKKSFKAPAGANVAYAERFDKDRPMIVSCGRLEFRPTWENCGVYLNLLPEEKKQKIRVSYFFREKGEKTFRKALDPAEVIQEHAWRGSLLMLKEDTAYEFKGIIAGEKGYKKEVTGSFRTLSSKVPFKTIVLPGGTLQTSLRSGTAKEYIRYTSNGKTVKPAKSGTEAVFKIEKLQYVIFDNIDVDAKGAQNGFLINDSHDIIIRNCNIYNFGRTPGKPRYGSHLYYSGGIHTPEGVLMYDDNAFRLNRSHNLLIERNYVHDPVFSAQTWLFAHPSGPGGVKATECRNTAVRYNDFIGRDGARFIDLVISPPNGSFYGGIYRDADYYGNSFLFANDDGAEIEAGAMNTRCYGNRIEGVLSGISTGPITMGPTYLFGNLYANPGDEDGSFGQPYKNGGGAEGANQTRGKLYLMHNTVADSWVSNYGVGNFSIPHKDYFPTLKAYLRNNILRTDGKFFHRRWTEFKTDCDGDLLERTAFDPEKVAMDKENIRKHQLEKHGIYASAQYVSPGSGNYALKPGTPGSRRVFKVDNLEMYPQTGAYTGRRGEWFPRRPVELEADITELHWGKGDSSSRTFTVTAGKNMSENFRIHCSDSFFNVTPASGKFTPGKSVKFTVRIDNKKMTTPKRYSGAVLLRTQNGWGLPVTLFADRRTTVEKILSQKNKFFPAERIDQKTFKWQVPADGTYFVIQTVVFTGKGTRAKAVCEGRTIAADLTPVRWHKTATLLKCASNRRLEAFELKKGTFTLTIEPVNGKIQQAYLTQCPWEVLKNSNFPEKSGVR